MGEEEVDLFDVGDVSWGEGGFEVLWVVEFCLEIFGFAVVGVEIFIEDALQDGLCFCVVGTCGELFGLGVGGEGVAVACLGFEVCGERCVGEAAPGLAVELHGLCVFAFFVVESGLGV